MAAVIASTSVNTGFAVGTDIGSQAQFAVTAPTGITVGDLLVFISQVDRSTATPELKSGWSALTIPNKDSTLLGQYKYADSSDVTASDFLFTANQDTARMRWKMYRITSVVSSGQPVIDSDGFSFTATGTSISQAVDVNQNTGSLLLVIISGDEVGLDPVGSFSNVTLTGPTVSLTEVWDGADPDGALGALYDGISTSGSPITNIAFDHDDDTDDDDTIYVSILDIRAQADASATLTTTVTSNTAFAPAGSAGAHTSLTLTETTNEAFAPAGKSTKGTVWTNEAKEDTTWTNETL